MIEVNAGGYLMSGTTDPGATGRDGWLLRIDTSGNQLWNYSFHKTAALWEGFRNVVECSDGGFAATGWSLPTSNPEAELLVVKVDANGNYEWNWTSGELGSEGISIIEVEAGGYAVLGVTDFSGAGGNDFFFVRLDVDGNHVWNHTYGGTVNEFGNVVVETSSGFLLFGRTSSFGAGNLDMWLVAVDASGNHLWNQTYGGADDEFGLMMRELSNGDYGLGAGAYNASFVVASSGNNKVLWCANGSR